MRSDIIGASSTALGAHASDSTSGLKFVNVAAGLR
jgi:hypothetical protein